MSSPGALRAEARPAPDRRGLLVAAAWLVLGAAAVQLVDGFLGATPAAAAVIGAVLVDLLVGRAGVRWSAESPTPWALHLRAGAILGGSAGLLLIAGGHALGWATVVLGAPGISIAFALVRILATAARDELLLRWLPVALGRRAGVPDRALFAFVLLIAVVPVAFAAKSTPLLLALVAAQALFSTRITLSTAGAVAPAAANAAFALALGPLTRGGVLDVAWWRGDPGPAPHAAGAAGWLAVGVVTLAALVAPRVLASLPRPAADAPPAPDTPPRAPPSGED